LSDDPFQRNDRTIIRPNPGGRRPTPPAQAPAPPAPAYQPPPYQPAPAYQPPPPPPYQPPPAYAPPQPYPAPQGYPTPPQPYTPPGYPPPPQPYAPPPPAPGTEDWVRTQPAPPPQAQQPQRAMILKRDVPIAANDNPMIESAGPVLLLLGRLRVSLMRANFANLMEQVADAIEEFEKNLRQAAIPEPQARAAKYALCATADDIVQNIPSEERHTWTQYSMLARFFGERVGGVRFFDELERAKADPTTNYPLLELMYACLAMGFQGVHRTSAGGAANLQMIQRNLYEILRRVKPRTSADLSPHWLGQDIPAQGPTFRIPLWALAAIAAALLFALFVTLRILLSNNTEAVTDEMQRLFPEAGLTIERPPPPVAAPNLPPPPPPEPVKASTQLERIRSALSEEIAAKKADAVENGNSIVIRVGDFATFASGSATVLDSFKPIAGKISASLEKEPGEIRIVGHTDNVKIKTARFPSNYELSLERAKAVAAELKPGISQGDRFKIEGKGDTAPVAPNTTAEGRARNRRVEISIPREETLRKP